jgi:hypothetical protein
MKATLRKSNPLVVRAHELCLKTQKANRVNWDAIAKVVIPEYKDSPAAIQKSMRLKLRAKTHSYRHSLKQTRRLSKKENNSQHPPPRLRISGEVKLTREQLQGRKDKAVRFTENVLRDPDRAAEIEDESLDVYADRRRIQITNPSERKGNMATTPKPICRTALMNWKLKMKRSGINSIPLRRS